MTKRVLPSGLIEGSPEADAAEAAESAAFDREYGIMPGPRKRPDETSISVRRALAKVGIDLRGMTQ